MKYLFLLFVLGWNAAAAQNVGLGNKELKLLRDWVRAPNPDSSLQRLYAAQRRVADKALLEVPHPIDTIRSEGLLQGDPKKTATQEALKDMAKMYALALVYKVSGDSAYERQLAKYLTAWAGEDHPRGDPIDDTNLDPAIEAFDMVKGELLPDERKAVREWLRETASWEISAVYNNPGRATSSNNWHSHRLKEVGEIGFVIGDTSLEGYAVRGLKEQIGRNLLPDGSSEDFVTRDALHYHVYDLEPLLKLAIVVERAKRINYYSYVAPSGCSIQKSVAWLMPFVTGEKTHAEFVNSTVEFDRRRAQNGEAAYKAGSLFEPKNGVMTLLLAGFWDATLLETARKAAGTDALYPAWQSVVNALIRGGS
jgi:hypothetical protein